MESLAGERFFARFWPTAELGLGALFCASHLVHETQQE